MDTVEKRGVLLRLAQFLNPFHRKQQRMLDTPGEEVLLQSPCMTVIDLFEMPGVVKIVGDTLVIQPCLGRARSIGLREVTHVSCPRRFNGTIRKLQFQHGFWVHGVPGWRLGFAVSDEVPWRANFQKHGIAIEDSD